MSLEGFSKKIKTSAALIVDDDMSIRSLLQATLQNMGFGKIETAQHGVQAMKIINGSATHFDFIICDWMMPKMDGLAFLKNVRAMKYETCFIMLTAKTGEADVRSAMKEGLDGYITKPFDPIRLKRRLETFAQEHF